MANAGADQQQLAERLGRFSAWFDQDLLAGERIVLTYLPGKGTEVSIKGAVRGTIEGADFMRALWAVWLGGEAGGRRPREGDVGQQVAVCMPCHLPIRRG